MLPDSFDHVTRKPGEVLRQTQTRRTKHGSITMIQRPKSSRSSEKIMTPPPKNASVQPSTGKVMPTVFWDQRRVVMMDFLARVPQLPGRTTLHCCRNCGRPSKPRGMLTKVVRLLQNNVLVHNAHVAQTKARSCSYEILPHPTYSPDLTPSDFYLFFQS